MPDKYKAFMENTYQFRENAKLDPDRAKITLDFLPNEMPTLSATELRKIYDDMDILNYRVALEMGKRPGSCAGV